MTRPAAADAPAAPSPAAAETLVGHGAAEAALREAVAGGRLHHAWLISGPQGIGKATLAYRVARWLLARPPGGTAPDAAGPGLFGDDLPPATAPDGEPASGAGGAHDGLWLAPDDPVFRRVAAGAHPDLCVIDRAWDDKRKALRNEIVVDDVRRAQAHFAATATEGGWRVAIVDAADEMNRSAANALLKTLEEPPRDSVLFLVAHAPGRLLPTIRSRCRALPLKPLSVADTVAVLSRHLPDLDDADRRALAQLSEGAPGRALALHAAGGLDVYRAMVGLLAGLPRLDRVAAHGLARQLSGKAADAAYRTFTRLLTDWIGRMVRTAARGAAPAEIVAGEAAAMTRLAAAAPLDRWVAVWEEAGALIARADRVYLDRGQVILALLETLAATAAGRRA
ncbi:DNA polymerase III delta prime subunit [Rhodothalassium salexigens DSM 2132]|uniref:DNA polymerase III delta prime subunit n=1 Tax=Rhodothalassium salexigens DSM 2132 TaxID=1188247 RepID=A0A4R2PR94_RHOSA|nr:DNA polymerase III subunit delta' [Rhodothalassium salexigens]MBB4210175.1 DNA polymerase-3 subunit delta' [Rhodothalassium salexigens DSM 2132]MBK1638561.1 hypothetical protein [Rhodothalassium salexigens DSM 2132]TCP38339.1 DNA polymerase III delta prime subunit [Rhodothalassium salexigens DSM 2132]